MSLKKKLKAQGKSEVPISSMIDVVFLLLTFFIFTSKEVVEEAYVDMTLAGKEGPSIETELKEIRLDIEVAQDFYHYAGRHYTTESLDAKIDRLATVDPDSVNIKIMTRLDSDHERLITLIDICKKHEVEKFQILSKR